MVLFILRSINKIQIIYFNQNYVEREKIMAMVSKKKKFVYVSGGRNATNSIRGALTKIDSCCYEPAKSSKELFKKFNRHMPARFIRDIIGKELWDECFKFTFIRNTYSWVVSSYFFWVKRRMVNMPSNGLMDMKCFEFAVDYYKSPQGKRYDKCTDIRSQHSFICDKGGNILLDFVGRFENLQSDFNLICQKIGCREVMLKKKNSSFASSRDWKDHYRNCPEAIDYVYKHWKRDIDAFKFELEL